MSLIAFGSSRRQVDATPAPSKIRSCRQSGWMSSESSRAG